MAQTQLTGTRIRERRTSAGIRQAALAEAVGISGSYLNLIEHNRRRIGGRLLQDIARALDVDAALLSEGTDGSVLDQLRFSAHSAPQARAEVSRTEEFAGRFPGWAALLVEQSKRISELEARVIALTDRLSHDPQLARSLHDVLSTVTSIRSTASILAGPEHLDQDWQDRFHKNVFEDSQRLAETSRALVGYLETPEQSIQSELSPLEEVEAWFSARSGHVAEIEINQTAAIENLIDGLGNSVRSLLHVRLDRYARDAKLLPLEEFSQAVLRHDYDPARLASEFALPMSTIMRRIVALPPSVKAPEFGFARCDSAGALLQFQAIDEISLPRNGAGCPLWPMYRALTQPGIPIREHVTLPGEFSATLLCYAVAEPVTAPSFDTPRRIETSMLFCRVSAAENALEVGPGCRICPRDKCDARREPSLIAAG